jgi:hypothetical protein
MGVGDNGGTGVLTPGPVSGAVTFVETTNRVQPYWMNWLLPSLAAVLFFGQLTLAWPRGEALLEDPGTGWHLRTGRLMLETGKVVEHDPFSFTASGKPWLTFEWGSEVLFALAERAAGLAGVVMLTSLLFATLPCVLLRVLVRSGISYGAAFVYTLSALVVFQAHALARPHAFSYVLFAFLMGFTAEPVRDGRKMLFLGILFVLWANLHAGFAAGLIYLGLRLVGWVVDADSLERRRTLVWAAGVGLLCLGSSLMNPHGIGLHFQVLHTVLGMKTLSFWQEFQPPDFYGADVLAVVVWGIVATLLVGGLRGWLVVRWADLLPLGIFFVLACKSQRHVFLLLLVAGPVVARIWELGWGRMKVGQFLPFGRFFQQQEKLRSDGVILPLLALGFVVAYGFSPAAHGLVLGRSRLSLPARAWIAEHGSMLKRPVTTTANGGVLIYEFWPGLQVGFDDRSDFYGDECNLEMLRLVEARRGWENVLERYAFSSAILGHEDMLNSVLEKRPGWRRLFEDRVTTIWIQDSK